MNVFVAGGTGVLGRASLKALVEEGHHPKRHFVPLYKRKSEAKLWTCTQNYVLTRWP
jgi:nucleoside-diphosphate-sugar epimerase